MKLEEKAKEFLNNAGYGVGSNYTTKTVIDLMKAFHEEQINLSLNDVKRNCYNCISFQKDNDSCNNSASVLFYRKISETNKMCMLHDYV